MGRPPAQINWKQVDSLLQAQCSTVGIASVLGVAPDTLRRACLRDHLIGFEAYSRQKKAEGKELLRAKQFEIAMKGDKTMLVWLGKQYLEQTDRREINANLTKERTPEEIVKEIAEILDGSELQGEI